MAWIDHRSHDSPRIQQFRRDYTGVDVVEVAAEKRRNHRSANRHMWLLWSLLLGSPPQVIEDGSRGNGTGSEESPVAFERADKAPPRNCAHDMGYYNHLGFQQTGMKKNFG